MQELKELIHEPAQFSVSTIDESPTGKSTKASSVSATLSVPPGKKKQKTTSREEEERVSVLKELGSAVKMYRAGQLLTKNPRKWKMTLVCGLVNWRGKRAGSMILCSKKTSWITCLS